MSDKKSIVSIDTWLRDATKQLVAVEIVSARLDAEIILAHTIRKPRTYLHAHGDESLEPREQEIADARLRLRYERVPIAYIIGHKEFYGRRFHVTSATLIPRPETEEMIDSLGELLPDTQRLIADQMPRLVDVGTGSGCIGITAKLEHPELSVTLADTSKHALVVAEKNARQLGAEVTLLRSDLLSEYPFTADIILANLPYVDSAWERSEETRYEPAEALFADDDGLALIKQLLKQAETKLVHGGSIILEADPRQLDAIQKAAQAHGLTERVRGRFMIGFEKR